MILPVLLTVLLGGIAALDAVPVAQTMLSQPLVTATLLAALWGDWRVALEVGVVLQLLAASTLPVGARTPEDYAGGGVVGAGTALALASAHPFTLTREACALLGVLAGLAWAVLGVPLLTWQRRRNEGLARWCEQALRGGDEGALGRAHAAAIGFAFAVGAASTAVGLALCVAGLRPVLESDSLALARAFALAQPLWIGLGLAQLLVAFLQRRIARAAAFGLSLVGAWVVLLASGR